MDFVKFDASDNNSARIVHCGDCSKSCDDTNEQSLKEEKAKKKVTGG